MRRSGTGRFLPSTAQWVLLGALSIFCPAVFWMDTSEFVWDATREVEHLEVDELLLVGLVALLATLTYRSLQLHSLRRVLRMYAREGLLPMCGHCRSVRNTAGEWCDAGVVIRELTEVPISHSICPRCDVIHHSGDVSVEPPAAEAKAALERGSD